MVSAEGERLRRILRTKRDGGALAADDCAWLLAAAGRGDVDEAPLAALLASIWHRGMAPDELAGWTLGMVRSGHSLDLSSFDAPKVDKHSTGGIGDKVSLPLAPLLASMGMVVPMISGRGLGHTGGTLDKLEAVPGVRVDLAEGAVLGVLREAGAVICAQSREIAPADRVLYALRDRVELVESLPLIASSIVAKKLAEGIDALVLDVKAGSGAFLTDPERGRELARTMVWLAAASGVAASARITWMGRPLGRAVGHALEVAESRAALAGNGPADLAELVEVFAADLAVAAGLAADEAAGRALAAEHIASGAAAERFERLLAAQGATGEALPVAPDVVELRAEAAGTLSFGDLREVGLAVRELGGGRSGPSDTIDPAVGLVWVAAAGDAVERGDVLCLVHHRGGRGLEAAQERVRRAVRLEPAGPEPPLLLERVLPPSPR